MGVDQRLIDLAQGMFEEFHTTIAKQTLSRELRAMGYRKLSARPRHATCKLRALAGCSHRAERRINRQGSNRRWMKVWWQVTSSGLLGDSADVAPHTKCGAF